MDDVFHVNVSDYFKEDGNIENVFEKAKAVYQGYATGLEKVQEKRLYLHSRLGELNRTLGALDGLADEEGLFSVSDSVFARGRPRGIRVYLGAGVLVEKTKEEALSFFVEKKGELEKQIEEIDRLEEDVHRKMTMSKVSMARIYNKKVRDSQGEKKEHPETKELNQGEA
ncbi:MAG: prefoldin subunit 3 [Amphiamblys sp. WSBS2006]|nr:MAG: prefoldin subunit 3 [Amphiamblys sp. WSBS2006]